MDVPLACVALAAFLIYVPRMIVARAQVKLGYDNRNPRDQQAKLDGAARRANAAHQNSFEAFAPFAAAVIACEIRGANERWTTILAVAFVALRVLYITAYVGDKPSIRSTIWTFGVLCVLALFILAVFRL
jgi:uncharacterized MAPEG superfamily protein